MNSSPITLGGTVRSRGPTSWLRGGLLAACRGLALIGLVAVEAAAWALVACAMALVPVGVGLYLLPVSLRAVRGLASLFRRLAADWAGVQIPVPYRPAPGRDGGPVGWRRGSSWLLTDPATWRDLLWLTLDPMGIWCILLIPGALIAWGTIGIVMPLVWKPIIEHRGDNWYAMIHVASWATAWLSVPLGVAFVVLGAWTGRLVLQGYFRWLRVLLAPTRRAKLALRVRHLAETRTDVADAQGSGSAPHLA